MFLNVHFLVGCIVASVANGLGGILRACIPYLYSVVIDGDQVDLV